MQPRRAEDAHNGSVEAQTKSSEVSVGRRSQVHITLLRSRIRIRIKLKTAHRFMYGTQFKKIQKGKEKNLRNGQLYERICYYLVYTVKTDLYESSVPMI
jgi:hypothetical protein